VAKRLGQDLRRQTTALFELWQRVRDGTLGWAAIQPAMGPIRRVVEGLLLRGAYSGVRGVAGSCRELWDHRATCGGVDQDGVDPTNNASERRCDRR
jgi:transposase